MTGNRDMECPRLSRPLEAPSSAKFVPARLTALVGAWKLPCAVRGPRTQQRGETLMEYRSLGGTGLRVSALGFGCGNIGGLLIRGSVAERERAVARAIELGINYFDTAAS